MNRDTTLRAPARFRRLTALFDRPDGLILLTAIGLMLTVAF